MTSRTRELLINIDGASLGNPGAAGIGVVICNERRKTLREISEPIGTATNNVAEYTALIRALEEAASLGKPNLTRLLIHTDSELLQRQCTGQYRVKAPALQPLSQRAMSLLSFFAEARVLHVPREQNRRADELAGAAARKQAGKVDG